MSFNPIKFNCSESAGIHRVDEPVSFGVPLPSGAVSDTSGLALTYDKGPCLPFDTRILARWPNGSIRWLLVDTQISVPAGKDKVLLFSDKSAPFCDRPIVRIHEKSDGVIVDTEKASFCIGTQPDLLLFKWIRVNGARKLGFGPAGLRLTDTADRVWTPVADRFTLDHDTRLKKVIAFTGHFESDGIRHQIVFEILVHFYAGLSKVRLDIAVKNPKPAEHRGGAWDLGDPNAAKFSDLSFTLSPEMTMPFQGCYSIKTGQLPVRCDGETMIFQASSGGAFWDSSNHVNSMKTVPLEYKGYKVFQDGREIAHGKRANPLVAIGADSFWLSLCCGQFWQNFPKAVSLSPSEISIRLFPGCHGDDFELQPGEKKTHTLYMALASEPLTPLEGTVEPLVPVLSSRHPFQNMTNPRPVGVRHPVYDELIQQVIEGPCSFAAKNETVDEFGWRNFGDVWADHESAYGDTPLISHYNNQYDLIKGLVLQFMRTGDIRWFNLARDMGDHVTDIDIYHTDRDKPQYNKGMFWHTDHHLDAATSTHRTISREHEALKPPGSFGGGPAPDHNYATGLAYLYWLTGESRYRNGVVDLAGNIIDCMNAPNCFAEIGVDLLKKLTARMANRGQGKYRVNEVLRYDGPSRVSGNSLNTLMDAYLVTGKHRYLSWAEKLILMCVSPEDDFEKLALGDAENRWMYTIFLLALGRYLDIKHQFEQTDAHFFYARTVLLRYASWMADNEHPYLDKPEKLEYPTETWAAQDLRKADIFAYAAGHCGRLQRMLFMEKSRFFLDYSLDQLSLFDTSHFTRPMAILTTNGMPSLALMSGKPPLEIPMPSDCKLPVSPRFCFAANFVDNLGRFSLKREIRWITIFLKSWK